MYTERELLAKKKEIENAKNELAGLKGEEKSLLVQLKDDWNCTTLSEAKKKIKDFQAEVEALSLKIESATEKLQEKYFNEQEG